MRQQREAVFLQYAQAYDEYLPPGSINDPTAATTSPSTWMYMIDPYVKSGMPVSTASEAGGQFLIYTCPDYLKTQVPGGNSPSHSYAVNANLMPSYISATGQTPATSPVSSLARIHGSSQLVLLTEVASGSRIFTTGDGTYPISATLGTGSVFL